MSPTITKEPVSVFFRQPEVFEYIKQSIYVRYPHEYHEQILERVEESYAFADRVFAMPDPVDFLDNTVEGEERAYEISRLFKPLPREQILETFGRKILEWFGCRIAGTDEEPAATVAALGYDLELFRKARKYAWLKRQHSSTHKDIMPHYRAMERLMHGGLKNIDLASHLETARRTDEPLSTTRIADYRLEPVQVSRFKSAFGTENGITCIEGHCDDWRYDHDRKLYYELWLDSPTGIVLIYRDVPQAVVGVATHGTELIIQQLQGIRPWRFRTDDFTFLEKERRLHSRGLYPFDWQKLMVGVTEEFARDYGMEKLTIQSGRKNKWTRPQGREEEAHMTVDQAVAAYDEQAKRLGFSYDRRTRNRTKQLEN